jgi:murein DD-endopeptidase MepM/ murein hydrolase activator NlpD
MISKKLSPGRREIKKSSRQDAKNAEDAERFEKFKEFASLSLPPCFYSLSSNKNMISTRIFQTTHRTLRSQRLCASARGLFINVLIMLFTVFLLSSCSRTQEEAPATAEETLVEEQSTEDALIVEASVEIPVFTGAETGEEPAPEDLHNAPVPEPRFAIVPASARPGEPVTVGFSGETGSAARLQAVLLDSRGRRLSNARFFSLQGETRAAILAIPSTALIGNATIRIEAVAITGVASTGGTEIVKDLPFTIDGRDFPSETVALNQENTDLRTVEDPQKTAEAEEIWAIYLRTGTEVYSGGPFIPPVTSTRRTSAYGSRRVYRYADNTTDTTIHAGVDYGVPTGTEVRSSAAGRVVLAKYRIVTGNTVVVEHMPGVYSLYYHMDSIAVSPGDIVEAGALLGESGSTGLATGPHLHWEIRVAGENADPDAFLARAVLDKSDIIDKLTKPF